MTNLGYILGSHFLGVWEIKLMSKKDVMKI